MREKNRTKHNSNQLINNFYLLLYRTVPNIYRGAFVEERTIAVKNAVDMMKIFRTAKVEPEVIAENLQTMIDAENLSPEEIQELQQGNRKIIIFV